MTFEEANKLLDEIVEFLTTKCAEFYEATYPELERNILYCLAANQYIWRPGEAFICWFMTDDNGVKKAVNNEPPNIISGGRIMFVAEHGRTDHKLKDDIRILRTYNPDRIYWVHKGKEMKSFRNVRKV